MMKYLFFILSAFYFIACDNSGKKQDATVATMPAHERELRDLVIKYPDSFVLKENLIQYFRESGNYGQAIAETDYLIKKDTSNERLWYMKATLLTENADTTAAINAWEQTIKHGNNPEYLMSLGTLYAFTKNPLALGMADLLTAYGPSTQFQSLFIKGLYLSTIGDKQKAIEFFKACINVNYTNTLAYREKAIAEYDLGKYEDALKTLELALTVKQTYDEAYYWNGRCYEKMGMKEQAVKNYQMALQITPDYVEAKDALAKLGVVL